MGSSYLSVNCAQSFCLDYLLVVIKAFKMHVDQLTYLLVLPSTTSLRM